METPKVPILIAMKGHPGTGKSTLAAAIATTLKYPLIDKDDIRDATLPLSTAVTASELNQLSYDAMWRVASTQLRLGLSVVVVSTLSHRRHLNSALTIAGGTHKVLIVECRPSDEEEWRRRIEKRGDGGEGHKPATWEDMERLIEGYDGCTEYDLGGVPRLVVDTTTKEGLDEVLPSVINFIHSHLA